MLESNHARLEQAELGLTEYGYVLPEGVTNSLLEKKRMKALQPPEDESPVHSEPTSCDAEEGLLVGAACV